MPIRPELNWTEQQFIQQLKSNDIYTQRYDTNRVTTVHTLAPTNTNMTNPPSTLAHLTHIYYR